MTFWIFTLTDIIFIIVILIFAIIAAAKGFIKAIFGKLCWIFGLLGAFFFYRRLTRHMDALIHNETVSLILCFVLIFVVIFLIVKIIQTALEKIFDGEIMKGLDRSLGFFFGIVEGLTIIFFITYILMNQPWFDCTNFFKGSVFVKFLQPLYNFSNKTLQDRQSVQPDSAAALLFGGIECLKIC